MARGNLSDPNGASWRFISWASQDGLSYVLALRAPLPLSFPELIQYYGEDILIPLLQAGLIGLLVAFAMAFFVTRSVAKPLQQVAQSVTAVTLGKLDRRALISGPREVRTVAEAFNRMTERVEASQQAQRDFLANVTHDLRTPLTSIQGFSQAIIDGVASNPEAAQRAAHIIYDEAGRLNRMVEELLDLARIEAGRWNMTRHTVHVDEMIRSVGERLMPKAAERGLSLVMQVPMLPPIGGDGDRLVQVFTNLIDNAIKHTPPGGSVTLRAILHENGILTQISDTGEGIPAEDVPHIFDRFYQVDKSRQRGSREGVGLGLTIVKQIVEAHGGKIWAESKEGAGTTIAVWFPAPASDATTILRRRPTAPKNPGIK
jgi:signal transduction histidine kinase